MLGVTLSRKPLGADNVASNMLRYQCGPLHVDACRISGEAVPINRLPSWSGFGQEKRPEYVQEVNNKGRWPANLILGHLPTCTREGTKTVQSTSGKVAPHHKRNVPMGQNGIYGRADFQGTSPTCYVSEDGTEVVEAWCCAAECPVVDLDQQTPGAKTVKDGVEGMGGSSRYFKQVGGTVSSEVPKDLVEYLHTLITPTQVGGESLIALDLDAVSWDQIANEHYCGVIARGEPTPEQMDHLWRIVKPGAHVLLIAPDHRPTGHVGACALEDKGFEIRDAILWVTEAGKIHYVPKANTKERNAGTSHLAAKRKGPPRLDYTPETLEDEELLAEIQEALLEAGVSEEDVEAIAENGIPKDVVPKELRSHFKARPKAESYGNYHPTVKPKDVMQRLLSDIPRTAKVVDPFMGSGTTGLACLETGHDFIGIEKSLDYLEIAEARIHYADRAKLRLGVYIESEVPQSEAVEVEHDGAIFDLFE